MSRMIPIGSFSQSNHLDNIVKADFSFFPSLDSKSWAELVKGISQKDLLEIAIYILNW